MLDIIYEDKYILVVYKRAGLATQTAKLGEKDLVSEVLNYVKKNNPSSEPYAGLINRLDQMVEGIVLFGLDSKTTASLSEQLQSGNIDKKYFAAICGDIERPRGLIADYLVKDTKSNTSKIVSGDVQGAKKALLEYEVLGKAEEYDNVSLVDIHLITGRHHQIRVQMAGAGVPLLGDCKYASEEVKNLSNEIGIKTVALCAYMLSFEHPVNGERISFRTMPRGRWYELFNDNIFQ